MRVISNVKPGAKVCECGCQNTCAYCRCATRVAKVPKPEIKKISYCTGGSTTVTFSIMRRGEISVTRVLNAAA